MEGIFNSADFRICNAEFVCGQANFKGDLRRGIRVLISSLVDNLKGEDATTLNIKYPCIPIRRGSSLRLSGLFICHRY